MFVLNDGTIVVLVPLRDAAQFNPRCRRHAIPASVGVFLVIVPSGLCVLRFEVQLAQFDRGFQMRADIVLAPIELPQ